MLINRAIKPSVAYTFPIIAAVLITISYSNYSLNNLAWVALTPLLVVLYGKGLIKSLLISGIFGILYLHGLFHWILDIPSYQIWHHLILLLVFSSLYALFGLFFSLIAKQHNYGTALLAAPFIWVSIEYIRSNLFFLALPYGLVGHTQYLNHTLIQLSNVCGAYGVSFLVVLVNAALAERIINYYQIRTHSNDGHKVLEILKFLFPLTAGTLIILAILYGHWTKSRSLEGDQIKIALIQGNIEHAKKWDPDFADMIMQTYTNLTKQASQGLPFLIVWPETATPGSAENNPDLVPKMQQLANDANSHLLFGSAQGMKFMGEKELKYKFKNSAILLSPDNTAMSRQQYNKILLFPFGEYLPHRDIIPWHIIQADTANEYIPGNEYTIFKIAQSKFAVTICWENIFPSLCREFVKKGAEFIINITNEARFGKSQAPYQMMVASVFRAVENSVYIARCANTGVSCIIDPFGRIIDRVKGPRGNDIFVQGILSGTIIPSKSKTIYTRYGNFFAWICIIVTCLFVSLSLFAKKIVSNIPGKYKTTSPENI